MHSLHVKLKFAGGLFPRLFIGAIMPVYRLVVAAFFSIAIACVGDFKQAAIRSFSKCYLTLQLPIIQL